MGQRLDDYSVAKRTVLHDNGPNAQGRASGRGSVGRGSPDQTIERPHPSTPSRRAAGARGGGAGVRGRAGRRRPPFGARSARRAARRGRPSRRASRRAWRGHRSRHRPHRAHRAAARLRRRLARDRRVSARAVGGGRGALPGRALRGDPARRSAGGAASGNAARYHDRPPRRDSVGAAGNRGPRRRDRRAAGGDPRDRGGGRAPARVASASDTAGARAAATAWSPLRVFSLVLGAQVLARSGDLLAPTSVEVIAVVGLGGGRRRRDPAPGRSTRTARRGARGRSCVRARPRLHDATAAALAVPALAMLVADETRARGRRLAGAIARRGRACCCRSHGTSSAACSSSSARRRSRDRAGCGGSPGSRRDEAAGECGATCARANPAAQDRPVAAAATWPPRRPRVSVPFSALCPRSDSTTKAIPAFSARCPPARCRTCSRAPARPAGRAACAGDARHRSARADPQCPAGPRRRGAR